MLIALWVATGLPGFLSPQWGEVCTSAGGCTFTSRADYYAGLYGLTAALFGGASVMCFGAAALNLGQEPTSVMVFPDGFEIRGGPEKRREVLWTEPGLKCYLWDAAAAWAAHPSNAGNRAPSPYLAVVSWWSLYLTPEAFQAILASARSYGCPIEVRPGDGRRHYIEELVYSIRPVVRAGSPS